MNKRHYEHTLPNIRGSLSNTYKGTMAELTGESWCKREHFRGMGFRLRT
ncbi:hypothetical protein [Parabacteroides distasonis]|nr:hypothetical protein [Parabacteroides distasonis]MBT9682346.1 hypothetical protein [Parabacteroides distasonis]